MEFFNFLSDPEIITVCVTTVNFLSFFSWFFYVLHSQKPRVDVDTTLSELTQYKIFPSPLKVSFKNACTYFSTRSLVFADFRHFGNNQFT